MFKTVNIRNVKTQDKKEKMAFHTPWNMQMVPLLGASVTLVCDIVVCHISSMPILRNGRSLDCTRAYGQEETGSF